MTQQTTATRREGGGKAPAGFERLHFGPLSARIDHERRRAVLRLKRKAHPAPDSTLQGTLVWALRRLDPLKKRGYKLDLSRLPLALQNGSNGKA